MESILTKATVNGVEYEIPEGIEQITEDGLFLVDFNLIQRANEVEEKFFNPRHLGSFDYKDDNGNDKKFLGQGFGAEDMKGLMTDISKNGLDYPLLCRWIHKDGEVQVQVYDGERRQRAIERLIDDSPDVWSIEHNDFRPAKEVYAKVPCRIKIMSDEEAMSRACLVSETAVKWGDAALARLIQKEYERGMTDDAICKMLNKSPQWVSETYSLTKLDEVCFTYLLQNKINRTVAKKLLKIEDIEVRQQKCIETYADAVFNHKATLQKVEKLVEKAEDKEDLVKAELIEAKVKGEAPEVIQKLEEKVAEVEEKVKQRKKARAASAQPVGKSKNLRKAGAGTAKSVTTAKVNKQLKVLRELVLKNDETYGSTNILKAIIASLEALVSGEDITDALKKAS